MARSHKEWVGEIFDRAAQEYGSKGSSFFNYFGRRLVEQVDIPPGAHILDVATGRGAVLFPLAKAVGPTGKVVGIDISQQMLKETAQEVLERNISWIELFHMDAEHLTFSDSTFDLVFCGFALFFLPLVAQGLREFKRVMKSGGSVAASIWGEDSALDALVNEEIRSICRTNSLAATPLFDSESLFKVLKEIGFKEIQIIEETKVIFHDTPETWWESLWNHGTRAKFEQLTPDQINNLRKRILQKVSCLMTEDGIPEAMQVFYGIAKNG